MNAVLEPERPSKSTPQPRGRVDEDEDLGDLPPLDGATDDEPEAPAEELEDAPLESGDEADPFDDATGEADPVDELAPEGAEAGWLDDAADADELDVGPHDLDEQERGGLLDDADEPGVGDEDFGLGGAESVLAVDAGEEGPDADDDELREEDLPRLDADDEGEGADAEFTDMWPGADDERPPWDDRAWERASDVPSLGLARSVVAIEGGVVVGGALLVRVDASGAIPIEEQAIHGSAILGLAALASGLAVLTERGLFLRDGDGQVREANGWSMRVPGAAADVAASGQRVWIRTQGGAVVVSADRGATWNVLATSGVRALSTDGEGPIALTESPGGTSFVTRGIDRAPWAEPLPVFPGGSPIVRARGGVACVGAFGAGVFRAGASGPWERIDGTSSVTAIALLDDAGTLLAALHRPAEGRAFLVRVGADKVARIVAEIGGDADEGEDPRVLDLVWDDATKIAWAVGPFGLAALRPR
jgi:hypothetical protein